MCSNIVVTLISRQDANLGRESREQMRKSLREDKYINAGCNLLRRHGLTTIRYLLGFRPSSPFIFWPVSNSWRPAQDEWGGSSETENSEIGSDIGHLTLTTRSLKLTMKD